MFDFQSNQSGSNSQNFGPNVQIIHHDNSISGQHQTDLNEEYWYHNLGNHQFVQVTTQPLLHNQQNSQHNQLTQLENGQIQDASGNNVVVMMPPPSFPKSSTPNMGPVASSSSSASSSSNVAATSASSSSSASSPPSSTNNPALQNNGKQSKKQSNSTNANKNNAVNVPF